MKIVTWNCNGALRKKLDVVNDLNADVLVVQECENPELSTKEYKEWAGDYLWVGTSKNKGVGVFPKNGNKVEELNWSGTFSLTGLNSMSTSISWETKDLELFLPFKINQKYTALGVWTKGKDSEVFGYMGQFWKFLQIHHQDLSTGNTIILGDFNSNSIWDKEDRWWSHTDVVNELENLCFTSLYHQKNGEAQGTETIPTFFHQRKEEKPFHIDYVFISDDLLSKSDLNVGHRSEWLEFSDHMPLSVFIDY